MRLDKLLANMGFGSRKDVKGILRKKRVTVNDKIISDGSVHVNPQEASIKVDQKTVHYQKYVYIMMNKAPGYISATEDPVEQTVIDLLPERIKHFKPFPVGRLDKDTEGLLLLSNDGKLAHQLTSPKKEVEKTYYARIRGIVTDEHMRKFRQGVTLDDSYVTKPAKLTILQSDDVSEVELSITEGKYHQVKRMFASLGKQVIYLKRIRMGELLLDETLALGAFRELTAEELAYCLSLKNNEELKR